MTTSSLMFRSRLAISHLLISAAVIGTISTVLWLRWYAWPAWYLSGVDGVFLIMLLVDLCLGPLMTAVIASPMKTKRALIRDLAIIGAIQLSALAWGVHAQWQARPEYAVFSVDRIELIQATDIPQKEADKARKSNSEFAPNAWRALTWVWAQPPSNPDESRDVLFSAAMGGADISSMPIYFRSVKQGQSALIKRSVSFESLQTAFKRDSEISNYLSEFENVDQIVAMPAAGRQRSGIALLDRTSLEIVGFVKSDPFNLTIWPKKETNNPSNTASEESRATANSSVPVTPILFSSYTLACAGLLLFACLLVFLSARYKPASVLAVLMWSTLAVPSLLPVHRYPQTVFYNEWSAAVGVLLIFVGLLASKKSKWEVHLSFFFTGISVLVLTTLMSMIFHPNTSISLGIGVMAYLLFGLLIWQVGQMLVAELGREQCVKILACGALSCALMQCVISVFQLIGWTMDGWIVKKVFNSVFGNITQSNHFADLLWIGMISLLYLWLRGGMRTYWAVVFIICLSLFSALSVSRSVLLYIIVMPVLAILVCRNAEKEKKYQVYRCVSIIFFISVAAQIWTAVGGTDRLLGVVSSIGRLNDAGSNTQRLFNWSVAWKTAQSYPLFGSGVGTFSWQAALASKDLSPPQFVRIGENAHNSFLHILAEYGWVVAIVLLICAVLWLMYRRGAKFSFENLWGLGVIAIVMTHSMVEYPLWYIYFIIPLCLAFAVIDVADVRLPIWRLSSWYCVLVFLCMGLVLLWTFHDNRVVEQVYQMIHEENGERTPQQLMQASKLANRVSNYSMFWSYAGSLKIHAWDGQINSSEAKEMASLCRFVTQAKPAYLVLPKCMVAYASQGDEKDAKEIADVVCGAYPLKLVREFPSIAIGVFGYKKWPLQLTSGCLNYGQNNTY